MGRWSVGTAVILNEWIGQREGDVLGMLRSAYQDGALRFEQSKTKVDIDLPVDLVPHHPGVSCSEAAEERHCLRHDERQAEQLAALRAAEPARSAGAARLARRRAQAQDPGKRRVKRNAGAAAGEPSQHPDRKSTRLNSSH